MGAALNHYMLNLFGPPLIADFGWERSQFALVGSLALVSLFFVPIAGRFTDRFGARIAASVGFTAVPLTFLAFSMMSGNIYVFCGIIIVQNVLGVLTTTLVFSRVIVERFDLARGLALSIVMSGAPIIGASLVPVIGGIIDAEGWRTAYRLLALISAAGGVVSIILIGRRRGSAAGAAAKAPAVRLTKAEFATLVRQPAFLLLIGGMFFCNFPQVIVSGQMKLVLMDSGAASQLATWIVSLYAIGVVAGRFATGVALDRIPAHVVAIFALGLPAVGLTILASPLDAGWALAGSVLLIGLAQGAEGDIGAYLTSRKFDLRHYSFVYSFLIASMGAAAAIGSIVLSITLYATDSFDLFLILAAGMTIVGALAFYLTGRVGRVEVGPALAGSSAQQPA